MDDVRILRKYSNGDFYLVAFIIGFILFALLGSLIQILVIKFLDARIPNFAYDFAVLMQIGNYKDLTKEMWGVLNISQFISTLLLGGIIIAFIYKTIVNDAKRFVKDIWHNIGMIAFGYVAILMLMSCVSMIYRYFGIEGTSENQDMIDLALQADSRIYMLLSVLILAPIVEELLFRRILFGALEVKFKLPKIVSVLISAVVFAALHAVDIFFFQYFAMALILCGSYSFSKNNILVPIGIHFLNNSSVLFMAILHII